MTLNQSAVLVGGWLTLAVGAGLLPGERERRLAGAGLMTLGLGIAAWRAGAPPGQALTAPDRLGQGFLVVNGGLLLLGTILPLTGAAMSTPGLSRPAARLVIALGIVLLWLPCAGFLAAAGPLRAFAAAVALATAGAGLSAGGQALAASGRLSGLRRRIFPPPLDPVSVSGRPSGLFLVLVVGVAAAGLGPHVAVVFLGVIAGAWSAYLIVHPPAARPVPLAPVLTLVLVPAYWLLATIAGPVGLSRRGLPEIPVSPAAELIVAPMLLVAAWATAGLWPLHRQVAGALAAPLGVLLLTRIGLPLTPAGLEHWRPLAVPLLVLGLWHAAAHARWALLAAGGAVLGAAGATVAGASGAPWLLATGLALQLAAWWPPPGPGAALLQPAVWLAAAWGGLRMLEGGLRGEVVYTALGTVGLALIVVAGVRAPPDEG